MGVLSKGMTARDQGGGLGSSAWRKRAAMSSGGKDAALRRETRPVVAPGRAKKKVVGIHDPYRNCAIWLGGGMGGPVPILHRPAALAPGVISARAHGD